MGGTLHKGWVTWGKSRPFSEPQGINIGGQLERLLGMQEHRGLVVAHSENKGVKQVEWGQVVYVLSGFSFAVCIQKKCLNLVFI